MEAWHNAKINKYMSLESVIENNGWNVDLFAVEVGGRGYCSRLVLCCFRSLCLKNCTINTSIKQIIKCSMDSPFVSDWPETRHGRLKKLTFFKKTQKIHLFTKILCQPLPKQILWKLIHLCQLVLKIKGTLVMQMPSCRHWVSYHHSGLEYCQSHHLCLHFWNQ